MLLPLQAFNCVTAEAALINSSAFVSCCCHSPLPLPLPFPFAIRPFAHSHILPFAIFNVNRRMQMQLAKCKSQMQIAECIHESYFSLCCLSAFEGGREVVEKGTPTPTLCLCPFPFPFSFSFPLKDVSCRAQFHCLSPLPLPLPLPPLRSRHTLCRSCET